MDPARTGINRYWSLLVFLLLTNPSPCPVGGTPSSSSHDLVKKVVNAVNTGYVETDFEDSQPSSTTDPVYSSSLDKIGKT